jgi:hypothetical protein
MRLSEHWGFELLALLSAVATLIGAITFSRTLTIAALILTLLLFTIKDRASVFTSGLKRYIPEFAPERNAAALSDVKETYCYLGVTFTTAAPSFRAWFESRRQGTPHIRILLADPESMETLKRQAAYECHPIGRTSPTTLTDAELSSIAHDKAGKIKATYGDLARLKGGPANIEVRLHHERLHEWMHIVDDRTAWVGLLHPGESGLNGPVAVYCRRGKPSAFDYYQNWFETLWAESAGRCVDLSPGRPAARHPGGA